MTKAPSFRIGDDVLYRGGFGVFMGYVGKTGTQAEISLPSNDGRSWIDKRVWVKSLTHQGVSHE